MDFSATTYFLLIFPFLSIGIMYKYWDNLMKKNEDLFAITLTKADKEELDLPM